MALSCGVKRLWPVKSRLQLADAEARYRITPIGRNHRGGGQNEITRPQGMMGNSEVTICPDSTGPKQYVEIERACLPSPPTADTTEMIFDLMELR